MRLGLVLLVALLLPITSNANFSKPSIEDESSQQPYSTAISSNSVHSFNSKPTSTTSKARYSSNSISYKDKFSLDPNGTATNYINGDTNVYDKSRYVTEKIPTSRSLQKDPDGKRKKLTVGYLTAVRGELKERQGLAISGALTMALEEINNDSSILPNVTLVLKWNDTRGDTVLTTRSMVDMICDGVAVFFGPEGSCYVEAIVAQSRNIPMISYKCSDYKASSIPTFARTEPPDTQVTKSVISLLSYYGWNKFSIIYEENWETVAYSLIDQAKQRNMTINNKKSAVDRHKCCEEKMACCSTGYWYQFIQETKNKTRIYVFLGSAFSLIDLMSTMQTAQLFDNGEYIVISVDPMNTYSAKDAHKYLWNTHVFDKYTSCERYQKDFLKWARSLLVVVSTQPSHNYEQFTKSVREYNAKEPFKFNVSPFLTSYNFQKFVSIHAAYLYDSVKLYAKALDKLLREQPFLNDTIVDEIASNGTKIIEAVIGLGPYTSITGATMQLDKNGDSEGNFSVLALKPSDTPDMPIVKNFTCNYQMVPVGQFREGGEFPSYKIHRQVDWPGGVIPADEPSCGFENELCAKPDTQVNSIIAGILAVMLFCAGVITISVYRKWKIEQEIEGLLWKIDSADIHNYYDNDIVASPSRLSLCSASATSFESRGGAQVFATTALYKGVVVRIKELTFSRKKDISRDMMKEMRLLRELRHDNINSFIGACVEPMALLLVTDYCAKGSLYDIVENEDIKLDNMFIASLVHDLIKGMLYIHNSMLIAHGNLKSSNCVVTSRWVLQITDFGLAEIRHCAENESVGEHQYYRNLFWKAPEILRDFPRYLRGTQKGDIYAFAIILYEVIGRRGPFGNTAYEPKEIIDLVKRYPMDGEEPFRPDFEMLYDCKMANLDYVIQCMRDCWSENPEHRPDFSTIRRRLKRMKEGKNKNIMDQMMDMMVKYANHLEDLVSERTRLLYEEKKKTEDLLHRMLPESVAERLTMGYGVEPESFDSVTIYFSDIVGFTSMSAESSPLQVVNFLNDLYTVFDRIIKGYDVYKVETIGDAYMVVSGLPIRNGDMHAGEIASMALDLLSAIKNHAIPHRPKDMLQLRIGIHTGMVVAGVVGLTMPRYCLFGDTVNTASRMESNGEPLKIHISPQCKTALDKLGGYVTEERGIVNMKGKGAVKTYWLLSATEKAIQRREVDLGELPPLFCRPRRSPKLNNDSRQASVCGNMGVFSGLNSRRHSSVPRGTSMEVESSSTVHNNSPLPSRHLLNKLAKHILQVPSTTSVNSAFGPECDDQEPKKAARPRRILSSIASSSDDHKSLTMLNKIRESKSLDSLPVVKPHERAISQQLLQLLKPNTRSLENCDKCGNFKIIAIPDDKLVNNNFPNGNIVNMKPDDRRAKDDVEEPLLQHTAPSIIHRRKIGNGTDEDNEYTSKKWKSLETVPGSEDYSVINNKNLTPRPSIRSWIVGLFNGNRIRSSDSSLRKAVLPEYNNLQMEKESIV
ncbi:hypothetical protein PPYR_12343 [Photinus pyralis]|uniref:Guanylate cyclase n=1 Tax=Photinus pyralis TaxID=7054 RepID=A0A1Y1M579_PHOPY|nr:receptor-type guanylate cyclase Gyc76C-like [Photinus pyralis]KAB0795504.1 hypothetical protein PPYR_12343 [Photinus pyralis]